MQCCNVAVKAEDSIYGYSVSDNHMISKSYCSWFDRDVNWMSLQENKTGQIHSKTTYASEKLMLFD